ncbi:hypothetical protein CLOP_g13045, partial [Closterium sp. NIES-67]
LCDRTYDITCKRGAKTLAASHLKQCVASFSEYDFLKDVVSKLPDVDAPDSPDDTPSGRLKRKLSDDDQEPVSPRFKDSKTTIRGRSNGCNDVVKSEVKLKSSNPHASSKAEGSSGFGQGLRRRDEAEDAIKPTKKSKATSDQPRPAFKVICKVKIPKRTDYDAEETPSAAAQPKMEKLGAVTTEARPVKREAESSPRGFDLNFDLNAEPPEDAACKDDCLDGQAPGESDSNGCVAHGVECHEKQSADDCAPNQKGVVVAPVLRNCVTYDSEDDYDCDDGA